MIAKLHDFSWRNVAGCLVAILVFGNELMRHVTSLPLAKCLALMLVLAKYAADFPVQLGFARRAREQGKPLAYCALLLLPTFVTAFVSLTFSMAGSLFHFQPQEKGHAAGTALTYLEKGSYNTALLIALIACMVDVPFSALVIQSVAADPGLRVRAHAVLLAITLYCIVIVLADRKAVRSTVHGVDPGKITLRIGKRFCADIPADAIDHIEEMREPERLWCGRNHVRWFETMTVTPFDQPNAVIVLNDGAAIACHSYGVRCYLPKYVLLYLDQPGSLMKGFVKKDIPDSALQMSGSVTEVST